MIFWALEFRGSPVFIDSLFFVKRAFQGGIDFHQFTEMGPGQFVRKLLTNWITGVKQPHIIQIGAAETFTVQAVRSLDKLTKSELP